MVLMYQVKYSVLLMVLLSLVHADSVVQTDWSGGYGIHGPVQEWGNEFFQYSCINYSDYPGSVQLSVLEHIVDGYVDGVLSIHSDDIDGDGDMDILAAASEDDDIIWWENIDGSGTSWSKHIVDGDFQGPRSVYSEDIDGDGYMDVLGAGWGLEDEDITWWENSDTAPGLYWTKHIIDGYYDGPYSIYSEDIDGDGYMDVLCASEWDDQITWWKNIDGSGTSWTEYTVDGDFNGARRVYSEDIDGDGDMDVLGAALADHDITWWENDDGSGTSWTEHIVDPDFNGARSVYSEDIDGDGDMDILGAAFFGNAITWWENTDGSGTSWTEYTIDGDFKGAGCVHSEDVDGDGDMDVLGTAWEIGVGEASIYEVTWWENLNGTGTSWGDHLVSGHFVGPNSVYAEDLNGDGDMDVVGAAYDGDEIAWWDLTKYSAESSLESSILEIDDDFIEWGDISWLGTEPSNTELSFLVRASDDTLSMGPWSDTITVSGTSLAGILGEYDNYLQYIAILETDDPGTTSILEEVTITWDLQGIEETAEPIPAGVSLLPIVPNPSSGSPVIKFELPVSAYVEISIFDMSGRLVSETNRDEYSPGFNDVLLGNFSPGLYFCRMISGDFTATQRFVVIK